MGTKAIISFSGGMDSATLLAQALRQEIECYAVGFSYRSKHNEFEIEKAILLTNYYKVPFRVINLKDVMKGFKSNLMLGGGKIPEGHYESESMKATVIPARNIIFASILSGLAWSMEVKQVWLGIHAGDRDIYPDCTEEFYCAMAKMIRIGTNERVLLKAPFLFLNKIGILKRGMELKVPYELTRTCYKQQELSCGKCGSCQERLEAFQKLGIKDPIEYERD